MCLIYMMHELSSPINIIEATTFFFFFLVGKEKNFSDLPNPQAIQILKGQLLIQTIEMLIAP